MFSVECRWSCFVGFQWWEKYFLRITWIKMISPFWGLCLLHVCFIFSQTFQKIHQKKLPQCLCFGANVSRHVASATKIVSGPLTHASCVLAVTPTSLGRMFYKASHKRCSPGNHWMSLNSLRFWWWSVWKGWILCNHISRGFGSIYYFFIYLQILFSVIAYLMIYIVGELCNYILVN